MQHFMLGHLAWLLFFAVLWFVALIILELADTSEAKRVLLYATAVPVVLATLALRKVVTNVSERCAAVDLVEWADARFALDFHSALPLGPTRGRLRGAHLHRDRVHQVCVLRARAHRDLLYLLQVQRTRAVPVS